MNVEFRKTAGARCRSCGKTPKNEMVIIQGNYYEDKNYVCQNCAKLLIVELQSLNLSGTAFPPKVEKKKDDIEEDLSNI